MVSPPRTREFYRPIVEDLHEAARGWRESLSRLDFRVALVGVALFAASVLVFSLVLASLNTVPVEFEFASSSSAIETIPAAATQEATRIRSLQERGASFGRVAHGPVTSVVLAGEQFTDSDLQALSAIPTLETVTVIDANVTDVGLRALRLPQLKNVTLVNTAVTDAAAEQYSRLIGPAGVKVQLTREFGEN